MVGVDDVANTRVGVHENVVLVQRTLITRSERKGKRVIRLSNVLEGQRLVTTTNLEPLDLVGGTCTLDSASHSQETSNTLIAEGLDEFGHDHLFVRGDELI